MAGGRQTEYNENVLVKAGEYLANAHDGKRENGELYVELPTVAGLAVFLGVARSTVYKWSQEQSEFSDIIERLMSMQENRLVNNGLIGKYNPTITKVLLTKHGYSDKQEIDHTTKGDKIGLSEEDRTRLNKLFPPKEDELQP